MRGIKILLGAILLLLAVIAWAVLRPRPADKLATDFQDAMERAPRLRWYSMAKSDLKNLEAAQEVYFAGASRFARTPAEANWSASPEVNVTMRAGANWWAAVATDFGQACSCVVYHGTPTGGPPKMLTGKPAQYPDVVHCDDDS